MRHAPTLIAAGAFAALVAWAAWLCGGGAAPAGVPHLALMTFAVAAFSGPVR